ncbi:MAG: Hsp33 family molecular chaperone HslO [Lachnospiraceae bacterium]|nr:Hsp33 family molecular chaperone HslO [Candidatus Equihabitans merdae]
MADYFVRGTAGDDYIRAFAGTTKELVEKARSLHNLSPVASAALGRTLTATGMMGLMMKNDQDLITVTFAGDGPMGSMTVTADCHGHVKGYVQNPAVMLPPNARGKLDVGGAVGKGILRVIRDTGLKDPYVGEVEIRTGEIGDDLTAYFWESEQVPSVVALGVLMNHDNTVREAGGFIIQLMPGAPDELIDTLEQNLSIITSVTDLLKEGLSPENLLELALAGLNPVFRDRTEAEFKCNCSKERVTKALLAIGAEEIQDMIEEGKTVTLNCGFCNKSYDFTVDDLKALLTAAKENT